MVFFANLMMVALVLQMLTIQHVEVWEDSATTSMSLAGVLIWHAAACVYMFISGRNVYKLGLRIYVSKTRSDIVSRYNHWGMEKEVFGESTLFWLMSGAVLGSLTIGGIFWLIAPATAPISVEPTTTAIYLAIFFWMPVYGGMQDYRNAENKRERLDALHPAFHARFPVSEILSMYECLRLAPAIFWQEYSKLPDGRINTATNQEFRTRVNSFHLLDSQINQRMMLAVAVIAIIAVVPSLTFLFLEGTLIDWIRELFTVPTPQ